MEFQQKKKNKEFIENIEYWKVISIKCRKSTLTKIDSKI